MRSPGYFGTPDLAALYTWYHARGMNFLTTKDDVAHYQYYEQAAIEFNVSRPPYPHPASLSAIVRICEDDFRFTSSNPATGSALTSESEHINLTCLGDAPDHPVLATDYRHFMHNLGNVLNDRPLAPGQVYAPTKIMFYHDALQGISFQLRPF
jgi:hypothetical protein